VNWKQIYGEDAFVLRPPIYESQLREKRKLRTVDEADLRQKAEAFAKVRRPEHSAQSPYHNTELANQQSKLCASFSTNPVAQGTLTL
jgi:hypothetical protein